MSQQVKQRQVFRVLSSISETEYDRLVELSAKQVRSKSFLMREALQQYLENHS